MVGVIVMLGHKFTESEEIAKKNKDKLNNNCKDLSLDNFISPVWLVEFNLPFKKKMKLYTKCLVCKAPLDNHQQKLVGYHGRCF